MPQFRTLSTGLQPIGSYQLLLELGRGGMGSVHLARSVGVGGFERLVVIKRLLPHLLENPEAIERFLGEARNAAHVHHAHVVAVHQVGQDDEGYFLVLDYVEGASLDEIVQRTALRRRRIPTPIVMRIALDALAGLAAVHEARDATGAALGMLHRDVSLENLLVGCDGLARLADFGIAKSSRGSLETGPNALVGKLLYFAPEYLRRQPIGPTLDVYGLGMTLWLALTGREPWPETSDAQLAWQIVEGPLPPMGPEAAVAPEVEALVRRACDKDPSQRFASAVAMARAIEDLGRDPSQVGTHADVSDYIQILMGVDLVRRRQRIAQRIERIKDGGVTHTSLPPPSAGEFVSKSTRKLVSKEATLGGSDTAPPPPVPILWRPRRIAWVAVAALVGVVALWLASGRSAPEEDAAREPPASASPRPPAPPGETVVVAPPRIVEAPPSAAQEARPGVDGTPGPAGPPAGGVGPTVLGDAKWATEQKRERPLRARAPEPVVTPAPPAPPEAPTTAPVPPDEPAPRARTRSSALEVPPGWEDR